MTTFLAVLILICTLSLGAGGFQGKKDTAHPATIDSHDAMIVDPISVCRYGEGAAIQRDLSSLAAPSSPAVDATPTQP